MLLWECKAAWCSLQGLTASLVTSKNTRETAVSQGIWLLDFTGTDWLPALPAEPFGGFTLTGQWRQISTVLTSVACGVDFGGEPRLGKVLKMVTT